MTWIHPLKRSCDIDLSLFFSVGVALTVADIIVVGGVCCFVVIHRCRYKFDVVVDGVQVMAILHKLVDPNLYDLEKDVFDSLKEIIVYLSKSHDMFKPELQDAIDKNQLVLDKETKRYVVNMLASKTERDRKSIVARSHTEKLRLHGKSNQLPDDLPGIVSAPDKLAALANGMEVCFCFLVRQFDSIRSLALFSSPSS